VGDQSGEFTQLGQMRTEKLWDLSDDDFGSQKLIVFLGHLLNELLIFVHVLESLNISVVNRKLFGLVAVDIISENTNSQFRLANEYVQKKYLYLYIYRYKFALRARQKLG